MSRFANGRIPSKMLTTYRQGNVTFYGTPYQVWQWKRMVAYVRKHYNITLYITTSSTSVIDGVGVNMYRDLAAQWVMRNKYGTGAAWPGTSSHGGTFEGGDAMAIDVANWAVLDRHYGHGTFYSVARRFGFTPGLITRARGYSRTEKWHIVMWNPYRAVPKNKPQGSEAEPAETIFEQIGLDMSQIRYVHRVEKGYDTEWMICGQEIPGGYNVTTSVTVAVGWGAIYGTPDGDSWKSLTRDQYIQLQLTMAKMNKDWVAQQKQIHGK